MKETSLRVLIVDDMPVNRLILASLLESHGISSDLADGGRKALSLVRENHYDLILLDHRMPEIDGVETLRELKSIFKEKDINIPVICHTTDDARLYESLYKEAGFAAILTKPIQPQRLFEILLTYLPEGSFTYDDKSVEKEKKRIEDERKKLPEWLLSVPGLDTYSGIEHCDTAEDYLDSLFIFASSVTEKANEIESFYHEKNWQMYTLRVHSVKSVARLCGALELGDMAARMEEYGKKLDTISLEENTAEFLLSYRAFGTALWPLLDDSKENDADHKNAHLPPISDETLSDAFLAMAEFVSCYDAENIRMVLSSLNDYSLPDEYDKKAKKIDTALSHSDWAALRQILS